ncbi:MAG: dTDP-4-dehydrorhamnose reductase [Pseudomonadota bacterium]|nr:dTDP-4-dehydrorhamnose reductase [Pseudomonadota bacterium]
MKAVVLGAQGQLGRALCEQCPTGIDLVGLGRAEADLAQPGAAAAAIDAHAPELVINAAAYTAVDQAESEPDLAHRVNAEAVDEIALQCLRQGVRLVHVSTDFVFDGRAGTPYRPGDQTQPLSVYGASKRAGEDAIQAHSGLSSAIVRTAWVYAAGGSNFVRTMLRLMAERDALKVVADQVGSPTWARGLAQVLWRAGQKPGFKGIHHYTDAGVASWYDFALAIQEQGLALGLLDRSIEVSPIATEDYPTPAVRPPFSVLDKRSLYTGLDVNPVHWRVQLRAMMQELNA